MRPAHPADCPPKILTEPRTGDGRVAPPAATREDPMLPREALRVTEDLNQKHTQTLGLLQSCFCK